MSNSLFDVEKLQSENDRSLRIAELSALIQRYQKSYYNGEGEISDAEFDALWDELKSLDSDNAILHSVGADSGNFEKIRHIMPMGSQEKAADPEQFLAWAKKHSYPEYLVEYKLDGASLELQYEHGLLRRAVTRGDGSVGDDITANARKMNGVLPVLLCDGKTVDYTGGIRGEVIMTHSVHKKFFSDKANCRNAANGLMKRKDGEGCEKLTLITYDAFASDGKQPFSDEEEKILWLNRCGFTVVPLKICTAPQEVIDYRASVMDIRKTLEYDIDGLVVKERTIRYEDAARARPDRQIAFKFSLEEAVSVLRKVEWSINGGTYTPVAVFDEVLLNGTTVQRASLANPDTMRALGVKIGCKVVVVKRGEIIPKIETAIHENSGTESEIPVPEKCEVCGSALSDEGSRLFCPNKNCGKRILHQLLKWVNVVDIRDLGESLVEALFKSGRVRCISDFYTLTTAELTPFFLNEESIVAEKKSLGAEKVIKSIKSRVNMSLSVFVAGFDIEGIGESSCEKLVAAGYDTLDKLLSMTEEQAAAVYGFADIMAHIAVEGLKENAEEMKSLASGTITIIAAAEGLFSGKTFCFTGELVSMKRADAEQIVRSLGGSCKSSVTKDLSYLVTNDTESGSSKNKKAAQFGIPVITEKEFLSLAGK
ncbi:NAD-dependent DNA ligase LigA [Treponema sp.]|uniref:NAD-dependent DNA ligase LigA n=1 Tax=Treponema sp. TaxID=166 RepID=UPI00257B2143|nr:NAD-dependent DNA ligase LigA [Treponema sp.]